MTSSSRTASKPIGPVRCPSGPRATGKARWSLTLPLGLPAPSAWGQPRFCSGPAALSSDPGLARIPRGLLASTAKSGFIPHELGEETAHTTASCGRVLLAKRASPPPGVVSPLTNATKGLYFPISWGPRMVREAHQRSVAQPRGRKGAGRSRQDDGLGATTQRVGFY